MRIAVSGGGTGGHIFPALAVCEAVRRSQPGSDILYIGSVSGMETEIVPKTGLRYQAVTARKVRKLASLSTVAAAISLIRGYQEAREHLRRFRPQAVVGTGGYVAAAAALAGASLKIPVLILAPDLIPGRTNRMLARYARRICVVFEETVARFPRPKTTVTGLPLRSSVVAPHALDRAQARQSFPGLAPDRFTILVTGGSQGARALNRVVIDSAPALTRAGMQVLHQTGANNLSDVRERASSLGLDEQSCYAPFAFLDAEQVPVAYRAADIIVCRGGISTLSEVMANALPSVVVPLPTAYADHQTANAEALARKGAALCRPEAGLDAENLAHLLLELRDSPEKLNEMATTSRSMGRPEAADTVAALLQAL